MTVSGSEPNVTKQEIGDGVTKAQIDKIIAERKKLGGDCKVVEEGAKRFLVCVWSAL